MGEPTSVVVGEDGKDGDRDIGDIGDGDLKEPWIGSLKGERKEGRSGIGKGEEGSDELPGPKGKGNGVEGGCGDRV